MPAQTAEQLTHKKCKPCEGGVEPVSPEQARQQLEALSAWHLTPDGKRIGKKWTVKNFMAGIQFFNAVAELAESENHHPDLHLQDYRQVTVELSTHAIGGLSENDFILAAKIDELPIDAKKK